MTTGTSLTAKQIKAREKLWMAARDDVGVELTAVEAAALWRSIADTSIELSRLREAARRENAQDGKTEMFRHTDKGVWSADASDLGWPPGHWPGVTSVKLDGILVIADLVKLHDDAEGEVSHGEYRPRGRNLKLFVWND